MKAPFKEISGQIQAIKKRTDTIALVIAAIFALLLVIFAYQIAALFLVLMVLYLIYRHVMDKWGDKNV